MTRAGRGTRSRQQEEGERAMSKVVMTRGKFDGINACADARGVIAAAAMDQRGSLQKAIGTARRRGRQGDRGGPEPSSKSPSRRSSRSMPAPSSWIPSMGLEALKVRAPGPGVLLAYEKTGYDATVKGRLPDLLDELERAAPGRAGARTPSRSCSTTIPTTTRQSTASSTPSSSGSAASARPPTCRSSSSPSTTTIRRR